MTLLVVDAVILFGVGGLAYAALALVDRLTNSCWRRRTVVVLFTTDLGRHLELGTRLFLRLTYANLSEARAAYYREMREAWEARHRGP